MDAKQTRVLTVWCPDWPVIAAGHGPDDLVMVLAAKRVLARSKAARMAGVRAGQRRRDAQRCCPEAHVLAHDPDRDMRAFEPVMAAVATFVPRIEVADAGCVVFDARGPVRRFGGEQRLAEAVDRAVAASLPAGAVVQVGVADGRFASAVAARRARHAPLVVDAGTSADFLADQPLSLLATVGELDADLVDLLARLGLMRLGDLAELDAGDVQARFGPSGIMAHRLACGTDDRPLSNTTCSQPHEVSRQLEGAIDRLDPLVFVAKQLADALAERLAGEGRICTNLVVVAETDHGERSERSWYRAGGLHGSAMVERARWQLAAWIDSGSLTAGVVLLRMIAEETRADDGEQIRLWGGPSEIDRRAARAATRLVALVGNEAVRVPIWTGGNLPGERYGWIPAATVDLTDIPMARARLRASSNDGPWPGAVPPPTPTCVPCTPALAELRDGNGSPVEVHGRGELSGSPATLVIAGIHRQVCGWAGPWPLHEQWWDPARRRRAARLQVVTDDGDAYLLIAEHRSWWVLGEYL